MKAITIAGRLTRDAETRDAGSDRVTGFSVAVDDRSGHEKTAIFFDCSMWGQRGEKLAQYLTKGSSVTVTGDLGKREHDGKTYLTVRVNDVTLQGGNADKSRGGGGGGHDTADSMGSGSLSGGGRDFPIDDDIPFITARGLI